VPALAKALDDHDAGVRLHVVEALAGLKSEGDILSPLVQALDDRDEGVAQAAQAALGRYGPLTREHLPALRQALRSDKSRLRLFGVRGLIGLGPDAVGAIEELRPSLRSRDLALKLAALHVVRGLGAEARPARTELYAAMEDEDRRVRVLAASALVQVGEGPPVQVVALLLPAMADRDPELRDAATSAFKRVGPGWKGAGELLHALNESSFRQQAVEALGHMGELALPELRRRLYHGNQPVRRGVAEALALMGPKARPALNEMLEAVEKEGDPAVRRALHRAIEAARREEPKRE
jgi:HEAT repeat protein